MWRRERFGLFRKLDSCGAGAQAGLISQQTVLRELGKPLAGLL